MSEKELTDKELAYEFEKHVRFVDKLFDSSVFGNLKKELEKYRKTTWKDAEKYSDIKLIRKTDTYLMLAMFAAMEADTATKLSQIVEKLENLIDKEKKYEELSEEDIDIISGYENDLKDIAKKELYLLSIQRKIVNKFIAKDTE